MSRSNTTITITVANHHVEPGEIMVFADGEQWEVLQVNGATVRIRRRSKWRDMLQRLWPFRFRGFWRRVWTR